MKKYDLLLPVTALSFSTLFYEQLPGVNLVLFCLLLTVAVLALHPEKLKNRQWWLYCVCMNLAAGSVFFNNSGLSVVATFFATIIFSSKSFSPANSTLLNLGFGFYSLARSPFDLLTGSYQQFKPSQAKPERATNRVILTGIFTAVLIAVFFLLLYRESNPLFDRFVTTASFEWISIGFILFTMFAFVVSNGLLNSKYIPLVSSLEQQYMVAVERKDVPAGINFEVVIATTLFVILNVMILIMNALDINYIYLSKQLPQGITLSEFVHDAVAANIFSMVVAAGLIVWLFRGDLNFNKYGNVVRMLVYCWIVQSVFIVLSTLIRNTWYIQEYQLTGQRIGVFVFLLLSLCGLLITFLKVKHQKSAWWLATTNFQVWFMVLVFSSFINWDKRVTTYNISHNAANKPLDVSYLVSLSNANLPQLVELHNNGQLRKDESLMVFRKLIDAYDQNRDLEWPSYNLRMQKGFDALLNLDLKATKHQ